MRSNTESEITIPRFVVDRLQHATTQSTGFRQLATDVALEEVTTGVSPLSNVLPPGAAIRESVRHATNAVRIMQEWEIRQPQV